MSLRLRLSLIIGSSFVALWLLAASWMLHDLRQQMMQAFDQRLTASARMVAGLLEQLPQQNQSSPPALRLSAQELGIDNQLACQVSSLQGEILARSNHSTGQALTTRSPGFAEQMIAGERWRSFTLQHGDLLVTTADRLSERDQLQQAALLAAGLPVGLALLGSLILLWFTTGQGLKPLQRIGAALAERDAHRLQPLPQQAWPQEIQPLVNSQNALFARIQEAMERERQLTQNLAHELRSPLTAIKTHLQIARSSPPADAQASLTLAEQGSDRLQHTLEQLLLLARIDGQLEHASAPHMQADEITRLALSDLGADSRSITLDWQLDADLPTINMPGTLAVAALRNLLENALRHGPAGAQKTLRVSAQQQQVTWRISDGGGHLSVGELQQLTTRFWRANSDHAGSGLGLAIVSAICQRFAGQLQFNNSPQGVQASLVLPASSKSAL